MVGSQSQSAAEISNAFKEVGLYVEDVEHTGAGESIRRAKRSLLESFHMQNEKKDWQTLRFEYLKK